MPYDYINISNAIMYKLCCNDINITDIYIGHTTDFESRKRHHKTNCNNKKNNKVYQFIRDNGGWDNWSMIIIEEYLCNTRQEVLNRERELIEEFKATLNSTIPIRTKQDKKERINCDCGGYYNRNNKSSHLISIRHKEYII